MLTRSCRISILLGALLLMPADRAAGQDGATGGGDEIEVRIGVRADAAPFSQQTQVRGAGEAGLCAPAEDRASTGFQGYSVELCVDFVNDLRASSARPFKACFVPVVTALDDPEHANRFKALDNGDIDLLCGATTATLEVRSRYRASLPTFLSATVFMQNDERVAGRLAEGAPLRIGVLRDTTSDVRVSADALAQRREVRARLGSARVPDTVIIDSHDRVAQLICDRNQTGTGCAVRQPEAVEGTTAPEMPTRDLCERDNLTLMEWLRLSKEDCAEDSRAQGSESDTASGTQKEAPTVAQAAGAGPAPVTDEIDIYIGDRPILDALLARMAARGWQGGLTIDSDPLRPQPYAVIFPPRRSESSEPDPRALPDLHFAFNRFLVEDIYNLGNLSAVRQRLAAHFVGGTEVSFLHLIPLMGRVPVGQPPPQAFHETETPAVDQAENTPVSPSQDPASPAPPSSGAEQSFGE